MTAIDYSMPAIAHQRRMNCHNQDTFTFTHTGSNATGKCTLSYKCMDATRLEGQEFADGSYDLVLEKGTLDALLTDETELESETSTSQNTSSMAMAMLSEAARVVRDGGVIVSVSHTPTRRPLLLAQLNKKKSTKIQWYLRDFYEVKHGKASYYIYVMQVQ